ncbi:23S rRNA (adenine-N6)-dimethyltransferase [Microbacterium natoriense]|uniref:23S rRNA (Adenine-N6)-dimethyltransferase n=1 Tax=Microbacterium natoriense TaxID=284570 RepID=A0AAW8ETJ7_9MICO|nr:23S ribosomal RNA methyltransferase Erm [Microbacterium natoriense]MDQ0646750.1 23S rRNA (adenine-N6)-dimethyltransferase [Microbacterium natoriense]
MPRSTFGGRHELGQNFLVHRSSLDILAALASSTTGPILELGAGDGAITRRLATTGRHVTAIEIDEHRARRLARVLPHVHVVHADALHHPLDAPVIIGNIPFHLTTPILRRLLSTHSWKHAVLVTQWEVARKRAGVGARTMMTAQSAPWFEFALRGRVPAWGFVPRAGVDGGILTITRRASPLIPLRERQRYERFVRDVFTGRGGRLDSIVRRASTLTSASAARALSEAGVTPRALPRDLDAEQWAALWRAARG